MVRQYTTLVIDLDGTLLNSAGEVSQANRDAVRRAREAGLEILIASGRAWGESLGPLRAIEHEQFMIAAGGALMCQSSDGATIDSRAMHASVVHDAVEAMLEANHRALLLKDRHVAGLDYVTVGDAPLDPASEWWFEHLPVDVLHLAQLSDDEHIDATVRVAVVASEAELAPMARHLQSRLHERAFLQHWPAVTSTAAIGAATHLLEIFDADVNKWTMIKRHCQRTGIEPQTIVAIGDGLNDVEMIREAGLGVAMGNADARVLAVANATTGHHDDDGVAEVINRLLSDQASF